MHDTYLIDRFIPQNSLIVMLTAPIDPGMRIVSTDILLHVALRRPWMGRAVQRSSVISYGLDGVICDEACEVWRLHHGLLQVSDTYVSKTDIDLEKSSCVERVYRDAIATANRTGEPVRLIGIDANTRLDFARRISVVVNHVEQIRARTGAAVMLLRQKWFRNDTNLNLTAAADIVLSLTQDGKLTNSNSKGEPICEPLFLTYETVDYLESETGRRSMVIKKDRAEHSLERMPIERTVH